jgi:hypothetical protein
MILSEGRGSSPATGTDTACQSIDFSGGNSNHGEMISP